MRENKSILGTSDDRETFLQVMDINNNKTSYEKYVQESREIVDSFYETGKMSEEDRKKLKRSFNSAPVNLRLGNASMNKKIQAHTDYDSNEEQSKNLTKGLEHCRFVIRVPSRKFILGEKLGV